MLRFWVIVILMLGAVMGLSYWAMGAVLPTRWAARGRFITAALDVVSVALFFALIRWHGGIPEAFLRAQSFPFADERIDCCRIGSFHKDHRRFLDILKSDLVP